MKIASFVFNATKENIGGAQIPAVSFKKWCYALGVDCHLVTNSSVVNDDLNKFGITFADVERLNDEFDAVFFSTPDVFHGSDFDFSKLKIKRASMCHAEFDNKLYGGDKRFYEIMSTADVPIVIGGDYWRLEKQFKWYPCCFPEFLVGKFHASVVGTNITGLKNRVGLYYSSRISSWKNLHTLALLSSVESFEKSLYSEIHAYSNLDDAFDQSYVNKIKEIKSSTIEYRNPIDVYNTADVISRNKTYQFNWDVSGNNKYKFGLKRINLSAVEAMSCGVIPIVNKENTPDIINEFAIDYMKLINDPTYLYNFDYVQSVDKMVSTLLKHNYYTYNSVKHQIEKILSALLN